MTSMSLVIATTMPVITSSSIQTFPSQSLSVSVTATVTGPVQPTGRPDHHKQYCGVDGTPNGRYFFGEIYQNRRNVDVTLEGCYQFCLLYSRNCRSYHFLDRQAAGGQPRCDMYGARVAWEVTRFNSSAPGIWYDLNCGDPRRYGHGGHFHHGHKREAMLELDAM